MRCDQCGVNEAAVHLTQIDHDEMSKRHLCEACATANGLESSTAAANAPLADFLAQMGKASAADKASPQPASCAGCGLTLADFKRTGRLGCAQCWTHYGGSLRGLVRKLHGAAQHTGKIYEPAGTQPLNPSQRVSVLRRSLQEAIEQEDFERAAALRDQIRRVDETA